MRKWMASLVLFLATAAVSEATTTLTERVTDEAGIFTAAQKAELDSKLADFQKATSVAIVVYALPSLNGEPIEDFAVRTFEASGIGKKGVDNGVLMLLATKDRKLRLEVGYGLEHILTDAKSKRITSEVMRPFLSDGRFAEGIIAGAGAVMAEVRSKPVDAAEVKEKAEQAVPQKGMSGGAILLVLFIIIGAAILLIWISGIGRRRYDPEPASPWPRIDPGYGDWPETPRRNTSRAPNYGGTSRGSNYTPAYAPPVTERHTTWSSPDPTPSYSSDPDPSPFDGGLSGGGGSTESF